MAVEGQDRSCHAPQGLHPQYHEFRHELCSSLLSDQDVQWFCVGILSFIFTPWLPLLILVIRQQYSDEVFKANRTPSSPLPAASTDLDLERKAHLSRENILGTGGKLLSSPPVAGPLATQLLGNTMPTVLGTGSEPTGSQTGGGLQNKGVDLSSPYMQIWQDDDASALQTMAQGPGRDGNTSSCLSGHL